MAMLLPRLCCTHLTCHLDKPRCGLRHLLAAPILFINIIIQPEQLCWAIVPTGYFARAELVGCAIHFVKCFPSAPLRPQQN